MEITEIYAFSDQPATCPKCGSRTEILFEETDDSVQRQGHACLSNDCKFNFIMENGD